VAIDHLTGWLKFSQLHSVNIARMILVRLAAGRHASFLNLSAQSCHSRLTVHYILPDVLVSVFGSLLLAVAVFFPRRFP
jgi:hypothetical protein